MKITFLVSGSVRSNFAYRALALARALRSQGHEVCVIAPKADKYNAFHAENIRLIDGVNILQPFQFATKRPEINLLPYLFGAAKMVLREKADLIYIYKPTPISIIGFVVKVFRKTPVVVDFDDLGSEVMKIEKHPWHQRKLVELSEIFAAKHADRLVVASTYLFDKYKKEFPDKPMHIMPNGVESDWFAPPILSEEKRRLFFMGSINRRNILEPLFEVLPEIIKEHPATKVVIVGAGKDLEYFKLKAENLNISANIEFTGWLNLKEARQRLRSGDVGYNYMPDEPTAKAASNMKVPQYMARGVVPLVSGIGDLPAAVDFGKAGYVCQAGDVQALKMTLLRALEDKERLSKAEQARMFAAQKFDWDHLAVDFYQWLRPSKRGSKQKIYFVATTVPDNVGGEGIRYYHLIKQLAKQPNVDVDAFFISSNNVSPETAQKKFELNVNARCHVVAQRPRSFLSVMRAIFVERMPPFMNDFKSSGVGDAFRKACEESLPDVVQIELARGYYCIRQHIPWLKARGVTIVLDCHDVGFKLFDDMLELFSWPKRLVGKFLAPNIKQIEIEAAKLSDIILTCSELDADYFRPHNPKTYVIPNGVDCSEFQPAPVPEEPVLIFMGEVRYPPNGDAVQYYLRAIHPKVKERMPNITLLAIGADQEWLNSVGIHDASVKPLGFVEDIRPYLSRAVIGICPVRFGSGTRIKIMTYMAAGLPVVSMKKGAEGVPYTNGHDIIITDDPEEFSGAIIRLLNDRSYRNEIARNGRNFILENYDWNVIGKTLARIYQNELG